MSLRQLEKELESSIAEQTLKEKAINEFIDKEFPPEPHTSLRLNEELTKLYEKHTSPDTRPPTVLVEAVIRLRSLLVTPDILKSWFEKLAPFALDSGGVSNQLVTLCRQFILDVLRNSGISDPEVENRGIAAAKNYLNWLVECCVGSSKIVNTKNLGSERRRFIEFNARTIVAEIFPLRVEMCAEVFNVYIKQQSARIKLVQLMSECISKGEEAKIFKLWNQPLLESLIECLEQDTDSYLLSMEATTLGMILPHICDKMETIIFRIYACYGRLCSWVDSESSDDVIEKTTRIEPLFMFLYGLFPNNTLEFCSQPDKYLEEKEYERSFSDFWDPYSITHRTELMFPEFLLHPSLLTTTAEAELEKNANRWHSYKSITDVVMRCVDLHLTHVDINGETDDDKLDTLLEEHQGLFQTTKPGISSPRLSANDGLALTFPSKSSESRSRSSSLNGSDNQMLAPSSSSQLRRNESQSSLWNPRSSLRRRRSKSQPPAPPSVQSPAQSEYSTPNLAPITSNISSLTPQLSEYNGEFLFRELMLNKNELDFANFSRYVIERKLVKLQKQVSQFDIVNTRLDQLVLKNKQLTARVRLAEEDNEKAQKNARTLLKQRTSYEGSLLEKLKELRNQNLEYSNQIEIHKEEVSRLEKFRENLEQEAQSRDDLISELEIKLKLDQGKRDAQQEAYQKLMNGDGRSLQRSKTDEYCNFDEDITQNYASEAEIKAKWETKLEKERLEKEGMEVEFKEKLSRAEGEVRKLRQVLKTAEAKIDSVGSAKAVMEETRVAVADIQRRDTQELNQLRSAHDDLVRRYNEMERELRTRRLHDEERMNELKSALIANRSGPPTEFDASKFETRPRGRGGVQNVKRS